MYESFYQFTGKPFQLTPDPDVFFESASHARALSYLGYGLAQGEGFVVITGEIGAGKSTLVAHLMKKLDPARHICALIVTSALDEDELVHAVAQAFGLTVEGEDKPGVLSRIEKFLQAQAREGRKALLVVDECQNLSVEALEELRMLSNFQLGAHPLLQTLLVGQPEFRSAIAQSSELEQLRQRVIASHHLDGLEEDELRGYVEHRLEKVGWRGRPSIEDEVYPELYKRTEGLPRRVNQVMNRLLLLGAVDQADRLTRAMLTAVVEEMERDDRKGARVEMPQPPVAAPEPRPSADGVMDSSHEPSINQALAQRDQRIEQLEARIEALIEEVSRPRPAIEKLVEGDARAAVELLEKRLDDQEDALRHMLSMLIELFEDDASREAA